ncbi:MAG: hypothetical protein KJ621_01895 [Proteobacteria bacterium]|nr:hypothetical protein [Pseudomonadota bacterium]
MHRRKILVIVMSLALSLGLAATALAGSPSGTVKAYFAAAAKGDFEGVKKVTTGKARMNIEKASPQSKKIIPGMGAAFTGVTDEKITGDKATAIAHLDPAKVAKVMWDMGQASLAKIKDPKQRAQAEKMLKGMFASMAKKISKLKVDLVKKGGAWLISNAEPVKVKKTK